MKLFGPAFLASSCLFVASTAQAAEATQPVDYTQRNATFAPGASVPAEKNTPAVNQALQDRRVDAPTIEKSTAGVGERRAAIDVSETRMKTLRGVESQRPETRTLATSALSQQMAPISTTADTKQPAIVRRYQDSLAAASASNLARFPALDRATSAKINRFVFRKNPEPSIATDGAAVIPAAGGAAPRP